LQLESLEKEVGENGEQVKGDVDEKGSMDE